MYCRRARGLFHADHNNSSSLVGQVTQPHSKSPSPRSKSSLEHLNALPFSLLAWSDCRQNAFPVRFCRDSRSSLGLTRTSLVVAGNGRHPLLLVQGQTRFLGSCLLYTSDAADDLLCV